MLNKVWITTALYWIYLYYIILLYYTIFYYIVHSFYYLVTVYLKLAMVRVNWGGLDCGNYTILGSRLMREANVGGGNTIQGLFSSDLHFLWGNVEVEDRWNKKLVGRLYFIISFWYIYIYIYIYISLRWVLNYHIYRWKEQNNYLGEKWKH